MIHAVGFAGMPLSGHEESAEMKASCNASSAQSNEPERRMRDAMIFPDSSRKTCSIVGPGSGMAGSAHAGQPGRCGKGPNRPDLDASIAPTASSRNLARDGNGVIEALAFQKVIPGELFLGLRKGTVGKDRFAIQCTERGRTRGREERLGATQEASEGSVFHRSPVTFDDLLTLLGRLFRVFVCVNQEHVAHGRS